MSKKKVFVSVLIVLITFVVVWRVYAHFNAKPVDPRMSDPCYAAGQKGDVEAMRKFCG